MAHDDNKGSKANDLLCVAIEGVENNKSALAVLRVQKDGQAQGALCYLDTLQVADLEDCHLVAGRALTAPRASKFTFVGLVGTGIDSTGPDRLELIQNDVAARFLPALEVGQGAASEFIVKPDSPTANSNFTGVGKAYQGACRYDLQTKGIVLTPQLQLQVGRIGPFGIGMRSPILGNFLGNIVGPFSSPVGFAPPFPM